MSKIAIIIGSTRPGRKGETIARWVYNIATQRSDASFEVVDIADYKLPLLDEPEPAIMGNYSKSHTNDWSKKIGSFDGFIFVTPEYNKTIPGALKNAIDYLFKEWNNKACGFVGYGLAGGTCAVENLRLIMGELLVADVRAQVRISLFNDFNQSGQFNPASFHGSDLQTMLDQTVAWSNSLKSLRKQLQDS